MVDKHFAGIVMVALLIVECAHLVNGFWEGSGDSEDTDPSFLPTDDEDSTHWSASRRRNQRGNSGSKSESGGAPSDTEDSRSEKQSSEATGSSYHSTTDGPRDTEKKSDENRADSGSGSGSDSGGIPLYNEADLPCKNIGGSCQDISQPCNGEYRSGNCGGPRNRQCCVEKDYQVEDSPCENVGGTCQYISESCSGEYRTGQCGGPHKRQCCVEKTYEDSPCENIGGTCQYTSESCSGEYRTGQCGGPRARQCCVEKTYEDSPCENIGGTCQYTSEFCSGEYRTGQCGGPRKRQCCVQKTYQDLPCDNIGGTCQYISESCSGEYRTRQCGGPRKRQCCVQNQDPRNGGSEDKTNELPTDDEDTSDIGTRNESESDNNSRKENTETSTFGAEDLPCGNIAGTCQDASEPCNGDYVTRKCGGPRTRLCCVQRKTPELKKDSEYKYGDIAKVPTTGASWDTSKGLSYKGVAASRYMARVDMKRMNRYKKLIVQVGNELGMDPAIIAGIISRESRAGALLAKDGTGDSGNALGLMQIDKRHHKDIKGGPYSVENIRRGTKILIGMIDGISKKYPTWSKETKLKGGIAAYNRGVGGVKGEDVIDAKTHHKDYSNDIVARAQYFRENGY